MIKIGLGNELGKVDNCVALEAVFDFPSNFDFQRREIDCFSRYTHEQKDCWRLATEAIIWGAGNQLKL